MNELTNDFAVQFLFAVFAILVFVAFFGMYFKLKKIVQNNDELINLTRIGLTASTGKEFTLAKCKFCLKKQYIIAGKDWICSCGKKFEAEE